jgi:hypothetical protein
MKIKRTAMHSPPPRPLSKHSSFSSFPHHMTYVIFSPQHKTADSSERTTAKEYQQEKWISSYKTQQTTSKF